MKNNLKEIRREKGITQKKMADDLGVAVSTVQNWEGSRTQMTGYSLVMVSEYLGVPVDTIFTSGKKETLYAAMELPQVDGEDELVEHFRSCSPKGREMIVEYAAMVAERHPAKPAE